MSNVFFNKSCPCCDSVLFDVKENKIKLRTNILIFEKSQEEDFSDGFVKCPYCKELVKVPINIKFNDDDKNNLKFIIVDK